MERARDRGSERCVEVGKYREGGEAGKEVGRGDEGD